ncbi:MAG: LysR family transcriptional regulator [Rhodospirillales bacterium]|nr:LysR family transcriptional regulator [Rhodospirillales bacterium]
MENLGNLSGMAIFARVVEEKGFSAAASALGLSKSAISKQLAKLEDRLGVRLLNRTTRRLSLTDAGAAYYERAARILAEAAEADRAMSALVEAPRGLLRVNAPMSFGVRHLGPALPDFLAQHPEVSIDLALNDRVVDLVDEGFDLAIRITKMPDSSLVARKLADSRRLLCGAPDYFRKRGKPSRPAQLKDHNCLIYSYTAPAEDWRFTGPEGVETVRVAGSLRANNGDILREAMLAGLGIAPMPSFLVGDDLRAGRLELALPGYEVSGSGIYAVYPHGRHLLAKVRVFIDYLAARFGPRPYWEP